MIVIAIVSLIGLFMARFGFSAPALILGFVLGKMLETYLTLSLYMHGFTFFFSSPASVALTVLIPLTIFFDHIQRFLGRLLHRKVELLHGDDD
jgi:putative tricarboxylic transport membrane protein